MLTVRAFLTFEGAEFIQSYLNCVVGFFRSFMQLCGRIHADVRTEAGRGTKWNNA
jgi:hypothetical protein